MIIRFANAAAAQAYISRSSSRDWKGLVLHHTYRPTATQYLGTVTVEAIRRYHMTEKRNAAGKVIKKAWSDIGYHLLVGPDGYIYGGRPMALAGAHVLAQLSGSPVPDPNRTMLGLCAIGDYDNEVPSPRLVRSLRIINEALMERFGLGFKHFEHRQFQAKSCPGAMLWNFDWKGDEEMPAEDNEDDVPDDWAADAWKWAEDEGLMNGDEPRAPVTREMLAMVLKRFKELS